MTSPISPNGPINSFNELLKKDAKKQTTPAIYPNQNQSSFDGYIKKNTGKKMTPAEYATALNKASNMIKEGNTSTNPFGTWTNGIKKDYKDGKIADRVGSNPVVKGLALVLGGLTSCTPVDKEMDLVTLDFNDPIANGAVSKKALILVKTLGVPILTTTTPIQTFGYEDSNSSTKCEYKIDKQKSTPDKMIYNGTSTDIKTGQATPLLCSVSQASDGGLLIEESKKANASDADWTPYKKSEYKVDGSGKVAKYEDGKYICDYLYSGSDGNKLYAFYPDGSKKVLNNFVATQVNGTVKN